MSTFPWDRHIYRNVHGRGMRRPVFGTKIPLYRTPSGNFDSIVASTVVHIKRIKPHLLENVECAVEDVPPSDPLTWEENTVLLSQSFQAGHGIPARIALYRKPIEFRSRDRFELAELIRQEIIRQLANLHGINPEDIDSFWNDER